MTYKAMYKYELADAAGVSMRTLNRWLLPFYEELRQMGVSRKTRLLPPKAVRFLCERLDIEP